MANSREGPNPLRPYYKPPSIGIPQEVPNATTPISHSIPVKNGTTASIRASARDMFSDIDYSDYLSDSSPSSMKLLKDLLDQALLKYTSVLLGQPFEVAKTILQVRSQSPTDGSIPLKDLGNKSKRPGNYRESQAVDFLSDEDSDPDEPAYFTSSAPSSNSNTRYSSRQRQSRSRQYRSSSPSPSPSRAPAPNVNLLVLKRSDSMLEVIGQLWQKEAAWGVWKGTNTTFVYGILLKTLESWTRGVLCAILNVPDPGIIAGIGAAMDVGESPYPWASLGVAVGAAAIAGLALAPLDLIRTKLIITPTSSPKRSLLQNARSLPSYACDPILFIPTLLHSLVNPVITHSTPLFLRSRLGIDPTLTPTSFSIAKVASSMLELFIKLPLETVLRRGQLAVLASPEYLQSAGEKKLETIVEVGPYRGVMGTMWSIVKEEGTRTKPELTATGARKTVLRRVNRVPTKGQGVEGLWRGWRVGMWGIVGLWGAEMMGGSSASGGGEF